MAEGFDDALARARTLKTSLLDHGVKKVSIELSPGRPGTPNNRWWDDRFIGKLSHHIVSRRSQGPTPGLWLVKNGRTDVPGPLANGYGGFDEIYRIICMGWANHPGAGGPWTIPGGTIPRDNARPYLFGTEYEGGIVLADWTDSFREFMGRSNAGVCDWLGVDERSHGEHLTWAPTRKIDRLRYTTSSGRAELRPYLGGDDMPLDSSDKTWLTEMVQAELARSYTHEGPPKTTVSTRHGGRYGFLAATRSGEANDKAARIETKVDGIAAKVGAPIDTTAIEALTTELTATRELLAQVADGQVTPDSLADLLSERLAD